MVVLVLDIGEMAFRPASARGNLPAMQTDLYTKTVLTVIAVALTLIAGKQFAQPSSKVIAAEDKRVFAVGPPNANFYLYNSETGYVTPYAANGAGGVAATHLGVNR